MEAHRAGRCNIRDVNTMTKPALRMVTNDSVVSVELPGDLMVEGDCAWTLERDGTQATSGTLPATVVRAMRDALEAMGRSHAAALGERDACIADMLIRMRRAERGR